jgi:hypothetical protein
MLTNQDTPARPCYLVPFNVKRTNSTSIPTASKPLPRLQQRCDQLQPQHVAVFARESHNKQPDNTNMDCNAAATTQQRAAIILNARRHALRCSQHRVVAAMQLKQHEIHSCALANN